MRHALLQCFEAVGARAPALTTDSASYDEKRTSSPSFIGEDATRPELPSTRSEEWKTEKTQL